MNRGLFERDKMMFKLMVALFHGFVEMVETTLTLKIEVIAGKLTAADVSVFLKAGSALDLSSLGGQVLRSQNRGSPV